MKDLKLDSEEQVLVEALEAGEFQSKLSEERLAHLEQTAENTFNKANSQK